MRTARRPFTCLRCRLSLASSTTTTTTTTTPRISTSTPRRTIHASSRLRSEHGPTGSSNSSTPARPTAAPKPVIDIKHIRQNPTLYEQTCLERNYKPLAAYPARILSLHEEWQTRQRQGRALRERSSLLRRQLALAHHPAAASVVVREDEETTTTTTPPAAKDVQQTRTRDELLEEARQLKTQLSQLEEDEARLQGEIQALALALPNLTSDVTPRGHVPTVLSYINDHPEAQPAPSDRVWRSHVHIGSELGILDFAGAATASGWGWYYLLNEGAQLEQALVAYALATATRYGWGQVSPPSMVYSHIAAACGFQPRSSSSSSSGGGDGDGGGGAATATATAPDGMYTIAQSEADRERGRPELCMAGTAEVPLAGMRTDTIMDEAELPCRRVAVSRCYRAEAGARGADTKGLYRVHEFTKVELFAWIPPPPRAGAGAADDVAGEVFEEMVDMQTEILGSLGLHCRVLEMPSGDLGASATRKNDIEAWFPSRARRDVSATAVAGSTPTEKKSNDAAGGSGGGGDEEEGWGEVTSASICTDYQTRRLNTRVRIASEGAKMSFPWTVNGTAMAVPRVLAAILENGWDENEGTVTIPEVLRPWMDGREKIGPRHRLR